MSNQPHPQFAHTYINQRLKQAFFFTDKDLEANRDGCMTVAQKERLGEKRTDHAWSSCGSIAVAIIAGCIFFTGLATDARHPYNKEAGLVILCGAGVMGLFMLSQLGGMTDDIQANRVASVQGSVKCTRRRDKNVTHYRVAVGQKSFQVADYIYDAFVEGQEYILYYTPASQTLVAAEHVFDRTDVKDEQAPAPETVKPSTPPHVDEPLAPETSNPLVVPSNSDA